MNVFLLQKKRSDNNYDNDQENFKNMNPEEWNSETEEKKEIILMVIVIHVKTILLYYQ